jgi:NADP-dependent 3-hydroxy acid dehydrogenase YdfG
MNKKIAITGHTKGIGKALAEIFKKEGFEIFGYSKSNGYDIGNENIRKKILEETKNFDIFINNAYDPSGQSALLNSIIEQWDNTDKLIINMSSKMVHYKLSGFEDYVNAKRLQNDIVKKRTFSNCPKILNIIVGAVDTEMAKVWISEKINPVDLAKFIYEMVKYQDTLAIQEVTIDVPKIKWSKIKICQI